METVAADAPLALPVPALGAPILVLGAPRSGTTWLAKIIDSHPDVLYRHEPDDVAPGPLGPTEAAVPALLETWFRGRHPRTVGKRPFFRKSWQSIPARWLRTVLATAAAASSHLPKPLRWPASLPVPDLAHRPPARIVLKSVRWLPGAAILAETMPHSRTIFILRHPCGQVASLMRGTREKRFELRHKGANSLPFAREPAVAYAAACGIDEPHFATLPVAAQYAWSWRATNEPAYARLAARANVLVIRYEDLCAAPVTWAQSVFRFAGLGWNRQTSDFVARSSTYQGDSGYYGVMRNAPDNAGRWRQTMSGIDQREVYAVVEASPLARLWADLAPDVTQA
jgi:hypothetical protein